MRKFNVGDKVKIRDDLTVKEMRVHPCFPIETLEYMMDCREVHTIKRFSKYEKLVVFEIDEEEWYFHPEWLELVKPTLIHDFEEPAYVKMVYKYDYLLGKFVKVEKTELTLDEIADKFNIPVTQLKIKK